MGDMARGRVKLCLEKAQKSCRMKKIPAWSTYEDCGGAAPPRKWRGPPPPPLACLEPLPPEPGLYWVKHRTNATWKTASRPARRFSNRDCAIIAFNELCGREVGKFATVAMIVGFVLSVALE